MPHGPRPSNLIYSCLMSYKNLMHHSRLIVRNISRVALGKFFGGRMILWGFSSLKCSLFLTLEKSLLYSILEISFPQILHTSLNFSKISLFCIWLIKCVVFLERNGSLSKSFFQASMGLGGSGQIFPEEAEQIVQSPIIS